MYKRQVPRPALDGIGRTHHHLVLWLTHQLDTGVHGTAAAQDVYKRQDQRRLVYDLSSGSVDEKGALLHQVKLMVTDAVNSVLGSGYMERLSLIHI